MMEIPTLSLIVVFCVSLCACSSFVGIAKNIDTLSYGLLDTNTGNSTIKATFDMETFNANQFAYSSTTQQYTFVAYRQVVYNTTIAYPPYPFGLQYDTDLGTLFGQVWYPNGTATLNSINPKTSATQDIGFYFDASWNGQSTFWTFVDCSYDLGSHTYYALYVSDVSEVLVGVTVFNGLVTMNLTLDLNTSLGNAYGLQYNNYTDTFYVLGLDNSTRNYDLAIIDQASGNLQYLNLFNNTTLGNVVGMGLDRVNNVLSIVSQFDYDLLIANVDLTSKSISGLTKAPSNSISSMLALTNL